MLSWLVRWNMATQVPAGAVEATLEKLLRSAAFRGSAGLRRFLEYVVRRTLAGEEDSIKEYTIGVEVFDRGISFDPSCDSIVRVEALKLRAKLQQYFRTEGLKDVVHIVLPKGAYRPIFQYQEDLFATILDDPEGVRWQAMSQLFESTPEAITRAQRYLLNAIERWPRCSELHVGLAEITLAGLDIEFLSPSDGVDLVQAAASRALQLDPDSGDAQFYTKIVEILKPDKTVAIAAARKAFQLASPSATLQYWAASVLVAGGRIEEALIHLQQAVRLEPRAVFFRTWTAAALFYMGQTSAAQRHLRDILEFEPRDYLANYWMGQICAHNGQYEEARQASSRAYEVSGCTQALCGLGYVEASAGQVDAAQSILQELKKIALTRLVPSSGLAAIYLALGRISLAAAELIRGQHEGDWYLGWARTDPRWKPFRGKLLGF